MTVVDAHLHVWNPESPSTPWRTGWSNHALGPAFGVDEALAAMDGAGVAQALLVPAAWDLTGDRLVRDAVRRHPDRFFGLGVVSSSDPKSAADLVAWARRSGVVGVRQIFPPGAPVSWLETGAVDWLWAAADESRLPVFVWAPGQLVRLTKVLERYPTLRLVVDHLNLPMTGTASDLAAEVAALGALARFPGVAVKASALPCLASDPYPYRSVQPLVGRAVAAFGPERVFWGTDLARLPCSYREAVMMFAEDLPSLSPRERCLVLGDAIRGWLEMDR